MKYDVIVVGAGPAGMMAAGKAALEGANVVLIEKNSEMGRKLLLSGEKDCIITNDSQRLQFQHKINSGVYFMETALKLFSPRKFLLYLEGLGVGVEYKKEGFVIPRGNSAQKVRDALVTWLKAVGVTTLTQREVVSIDTTDGVVSGVTVMHNQVEEALQAKAVVVATGGLSFPETGSTGDGHTMATTLGHEVSPTMGALVPLTLGNRSVFNALDTIELRGVRLYLWHQGKKVDDRVGELLFTSFGIDGTAPRDISRSVSEYMQKETAPILTLDCIPSVDEGDLEKELITLFGENGTEEVHSLLKKYVSAPLATFLAGSIAGISTKTTGGVVSTAQRKKLRAALKRLDLPLEGTRSIEHAQITAGGIDLNSINPETLESYIASGLFFAGEVLNVDANRGGYNLQMAWSTGRLAGSSAAAVQ